MASPTPVCTNCTDLRAQLAGLRGERDEYKKAYVEEVEGHELARARYEMRNTGEENEGLRQRIAELEEEKARREDEKARREEVKKRIEERREAREVRKAEEARKAERLREETAVDWGRLRQMGRDLCRKEAEVSRLKGHNEELIFNLEKKSGEIARLKEHKEDWVFGLNNIIRELEGESEDALRTHTSGTTICASSTETANSRTDRRIIRENNALSPYLTTCWRCGWRLDRRLIRVDGAAGRKKDEDDWDDAPVLIAHD